MFNLFLMTFLCWFSLCASIINYSNIKMITINNTDSYFGYSVLLQKGNPPLAIVGAPKKKSYGKSTGTVYKCNLANLNCEEYKSLIRENVNYPYGKNGDFLGSVLDGEDRAGGIFFTCAPRFITAPDSENYFTNGRCFFARNSYNVYDSATLILPLRSVNQVAVYRYVPFYDAGFGQAGSSLLFSFENKELIIGSPGKSLWNGALAAVRTPFYAHSTKIYSLQPDLITYHDNYYGYAVAWGRFIKNSSEVWYVSGGPRGSELKGNVIFFEKNLATIKGKLYGEEFGSYFGASLLVIHRNGGGDDILVGAPMYAGSSWDEGCVYYYKNRNDGTFHPPIKLSRKISSSRFGTVMADLGDMNLDSFPDCAISAPYEDDGVGAVYLYLGTIKGFSNDYFHRISPSNFAVSFPKAVIKGFGMGLSKGTDLKNKKHNDIAVGAFLSGHVFFFESKELIDVTVNVTSNKKILYTSTTNFSVNYCIEFFYRNGKTRKQSFLISLVLADDRVLNERNLTKTITLQTNKIGCYTHNVFLRINHINIEPLTVLFLCALSDTDDKMLTEKYLNIPFSYECGEDNICHTNLTIKTKQIYPTKIIMGLDNELKINITISNAGESAYQTKLYLKVPPEIGLINLRECSSENGSYACQVSQILNGTIEKYFLLDLANIQPDVTSLNISFTVESIGQDVYLPDNKLELEIPVVTVSNPYIHSRSEPDVFLNVTDKYLEVTHFFLIGNRGPSPFNLSLEILVPQIKTNGNSIIRIETPEEFSNGIVSECKIVEKPLPKYISSMQKQVNNTKLINCFVPNINCSSVVCTGEYLPKSSENVVIALKMVIDSSIVNLFDEKSKLLMSSIAHFSNGTKIFQTTVSTLIYGKSKSTAIPLWIYISSALSGFAILLLLIVGLYKCNFFKRAYRERLENEQFGFEENSTETATQEPTEEL